MRFSTAALVTIAALAGHTAATPCLVPQIIHDMTAKYKQIDFKDKAARKTVVDFMKGSIKTVLKDKHMICSFDMMDKLYDYLQDHIHNLHKLNREVLGMEKDEYNEYHGEDLPETEISKEIDDLDDFASTCIGEAVRSLEKVGVTRLTVFDTFRDLDAVTSWLEKNKKSDGEKQTQTKIFTEFYDNFKAVEIFTKAVNAEGKVQKILDDLLAADPLALRGFNIAKNMFALISMRDRAINSRDLVEFEIRRRQKPVYYIPATYIDPKAQWNAYGSFAIERMTRLERVLELEAILPSPRSLPVALIYARAFAPLLKETENILGIMGKEMKKMANKAPEGWKVTLAKLNILYTKVYSIRQEYVRIYEASHQKPGVSINGNIGEKDAPATREKSMQQKGM